MQSDPARRARGAKKIGEILGQPPEQVERNLGDIAPGLATYVLETIFGEIYQSPVLDSKTRHLGNRACDHQGGAVVVVAARPNGNKAVLLELV